MLYNIKIKFKSFNYSTLDRAVLTIINAIKESGGEIVGPIPLPKRIEKFTVVRSPHVDKKSMEKYAKIRHVRLIMIMSATSIIVETLSKLDVPSGVATEISLVKS